MRKVLNIAVVALMMTGAAAFACDSCGCTPKKEAKKANCSDCTKGKEKDVAKCAAKKECPAECKKACCTEKSSAKCSDKDKKACTTPKAAE